MQLTYYQFLEQEKNKQNETDEIGFYQLFKFIYDNDSDFSYCSNSEVYLTENQAELAGQEWTKANKDSNKYHSYTVQFSPITPIILSDEELQRADVLVEQTVKWVQEHPSYVTEDDSDNLRERFQTGILGEMAVAKYLNIDCSYTPDGFFANNRADIEQYSLGVKTTLAGRKHLVNTFNKWNQVLCFLKDNKIYILGVIDKETINNYSVELEYGSENLKKRKRKLTDYCYQHLTPLKEYIERLEVDNNEE